MSSFIKNNKYAVFVFNLTVIYIVGISGICLASTEDRLLFLKLTPLNLTVTAFFLLLFHKKWNTVFIGSSICIALVGFFVEVLGVRTGNIFGTYYYGENLGFKILEVPVVIGLNWLLLIYAISGSLSKIRSTFLFALIAAGIMTLLDFFIEPIAIKLDFWQWNKDVIPLQNYIAWYLISGLLFYAYRELNGAIENKFSYVVLLIQFLFFGLLNVLLP